MKILHLEDSDNDAELIRETLVVEGIRNDVKRVETRDEFIEALEHPGWDLILADYSLPAFDGITALKLAIARCPEVPFIFVTGSLGDEIAVETLKTGATDYILKHRLWRLAPAVRRAMREVELDRGKKQAERKFHSLLDAGPDAMVVMDQACNIVLISAEAERLFGYRREELLGHQIELLIPQWYRDPRFFEESRVHLMGVETELYGQRKDGTEFAVEISLCPLDTGEGLLVSSAIRDITERNEIQKKMKASLVEKELLLQEVHHRVKNNLQVICSLLGMRSRAGGNRATIAALRESQERVQSMALIHELLYGSVAASHIDFVQYANLLASELAESHGVDRRRVRLEFQMDPIHFDLDRAMPCGLILNELLSNVFKYAFPKQREGVVHVSLKEDGPDRIRLCVQDDGVGVPEGFSWRETNSIGIKIVDLLAQQLNGHFKILSGPGVTFEVNFAKDSQKTRKIQNDSCPAGLQHAEN
jgi:PAS domain S-box-containing protein